MTKMRIKPFCITINHSCPSCRSNRFSLTYYFVAHLTRYMAAALLFRSELGQIAQDRTELEESDTYSIL